MTDVLALVELKAGELGAEDPPMTEVLVEVALDNAILDALPTALLSRWPTVEEATLPPAEAVTLNPATRRAAL